MTAEVRGSTTSPSISPWLASSWKRCLDVCVAIALLAVALPILVICGAAVKLSSRGPILFRHQRAGRFGEPFEVLKLRTMRQMVPTSQEPAEGVSDSDRLTTLGKFLRRFSLDELPQLINVIQGDMSIVGPRPLPMSYVERYSENEGRRLSARPGLTGLSQVTIRNSGDWPEKLALDVGYVGSASLGMDVRIIFRTVRIVVTGAGFSAPGHATTPEFMPGHQSRN